LSSELAALSREAASTRNRRGWGVGLVVGWLEFNIEVYSAWKREMLPRLVSVNLFLFLLHIRT
jgi:hypothetical protein